MKASDPTISQTVHIGKISADGIAAGVKSKRTLKTTRPMHVADLSEDAVRLAATINGSLTESNQMVLLTGVAEHDGVSTVASQVGLALGLMDLGPILLVDVNFHRPTMHHCFNQPLGPGLAEILRKEVTLEMALVDTGIHNISLLPTGQCGADFFTPLLSRQCTSLFDRIRKQFRLTLVDSAPLLTYPETVVLAAQADRVVAVAAKGLRTRNEMLELRRMLDRVNANFLGIVLTDPPHGTNWPKRLWGNRH